MSGPGADPDAFDPVAFLERAVATPSHEDVSEMRALLVETVEDAGHAARVDDAGNVLATRGSGRPHVVLNTHVDTVPPHVPAERDGDVLRGRGACDAKGPLAALLAGFLGSDPAGRVTLAVTPDEETDSTGAAALDVEGGLVPGAEVPAPPDAAVVGEPTGLDVCTASKGRFQATVRLEGVSAHAAEPASGVNAVAGAAGALAAIDTFDERPDAHGAHPELGAPTLVPTTIEGGGATNQVPAVCEIVVDRRPVPSETAASFRAALEAWVREHVPADVGVSVTLADRAAPFLEAFHTDPDARVVAAMQAAGAGAVRPFGAATEASYFAAHAPTVVFGPGDLADEEGAVAHADREYVRLPDVERAAAIVTDALDALDAP